MEKFDDLCKFIEVQERQHEENDPVDMKVAATSGEDRNLASGMSMFGSDRSSAMDRQDRVYIPAAFQKSRKQKIEDQNDMLTRMQNLMNDTRASQAMTGDYKFG